MTRFVYGLLLSLAACGGARDRHPQVEPLDVGPSVSYGRVVPQCRRGMAFRAGAREYCVTEELLSWQMADRRCVDMGGELAHFESTASWHELLREAVSPVGQHSLWIDLHRPQSEWVWHSQGDPLDHNLWAEGEPNNHGGDERCGEWLSQSGRVNDIACGARRAPLCELAVDESQRATKCDGLELASSGSRYCVMTRASVPWVEAPSTCRIKGWSLASLETPEETAFVRDAIAARLTMSRLWLGLSDQWHEDYWQWSSGDPVRKTRWGQNQPDDHEGEDCGEWRLDARDWNDIPCDRPRRALCLLTDDVSVTAR